MGRGGVRLEVLKVFWPFCCSASGYLPWLPFPVEISLFSASQILFKCVKISPCWQPWILQAALPAALLQFCSEEGMCLPKAEWKGFAEYGPVSVEFDRAGGCKTVKKLVYVQRHQVSDIMVKTWGSFSICSCVGFFTDIWPLVQSFHAFIHFTCCFSLKPRWWHNINKPNFTYHPDCP